MRYFAALFLVTATSAVVASAAAEDPPLITGKPPRRPPGFVNPSNYPPAWQGVVATLNQFAYLQDMATRQFDAVTAKYNTGGRHNLHRWEWLTAKREAIRTVDRCWREAQVLDQKFWSQCGALKNPADPSIDPLETKARRISKFYEYRLDCREVWYYTAGGHHWKWEQSESGGPLNARLERIICKNIGCTTRQFERFLAWVDLVATDLLPAHMSQFLTIPFALIS